MMNADRAMLTDAMQDRVKDILPGKAADPGGTAADNRLFLEAVLWRTRTGSPWGDLPERFGKQTAFSSVSAVRKSLIGARLKQGGMHWSVRGANAIIALRCAIHSNRFDDFRERRAA